MIIVGKKFRLKIALINFKMMATITLSNVKLTYDHQIFRKIALDSNPNHGLISKK